MSLVSGLLLLLRSESLSPFMQCGVCTYITFESNQRLAYIQCTWWKERGWFQIFYQLSQEQSLLLGLNGFLGRSYAEAISLNTEEKLLDHDHDGCRKMGNSWTMMAAEDEKLLDHDGCRWWLLEANDGSAAQMSEDHLQFLDRLLVEEVLAGERKCPSIQNCLTFTFYPVLGVWHKDLWMCNKV